MPKTTENYAFRCNECDRKFRTIAAAERAVAKGCKCGGHDIDVDIDAGANEVGRVGVSR